MATATLLRQIQTPRVKLYFWHMGERGPGCSSVVALYLDGSLIGDFKGPSFREAVRLAVARVRKLAGWGVYPSLAKVAKEA